MGHFDEILKLPQDGLEKGRPGEKEGLGNLARKVVRPLKKNGQEKISGRLDRQKASLTNLLLQGYV